MPGTGAESSPRAPRVIPKHELRKIKQHVARMRKKGHEIWTDEEVESAGWVLSDAQLARAVHVVKERQQEHWDCGLACAQMVLGTLGEAKPSGQALFQRLASPSVWTIDLAYLLADLGVACEYLTATAVMDATAYQGNAFYTSSLDDDSQRVSCLFRAAADEGVRVSIKTLGAAELWNLMRDEDTLVIALVDAGILHTRVVGQPPAGLSAAAARGGERPSTFAGHYVLLLGLDDVRGGFIVNDPGREDERTFVHAASLEAARTADGTDQDLILIPVYQQQPPVPPAPDTLPKIVRVCREHQVALSARAF